MIALSQSLLRLSMCLPIGVAAIALAASMPAVGAPPKPSPYYGRWTVAEDKPVFTERGRLYRTIDVAPCGGDFCGVSVDDKGVCKGVLFRIAGGSKGRDTVRGHGKWGAEQKNIAIFTGEATGPEGDTNFELYLGDGHDLGGRSGSMPKFHSYYRRLGAARCFAK